MLLRRNILATYASQIYGAIIGLVMLPVYWRYLGTEAYGLIAFFAMLQGWLQLLDMGLMQTMSREAARFRGGGTSAQDLRALLRSMEAIYVVLALIAGGAIFLSANVIAASWLKAEHLSASDLRSAIELMAITVVLRCIGDLYRGLIAGLERMVWLSGAGAVFATIRFVAIVPWLIWVSNDILDFFIFQLAVGILENLVIAAKSYVLLPSSAVKARWSWKPARNVLGFSMAMGLATVLWVFVSQSDKLLLSGLLSLTDYGQFNLAIAAAGGVTMLTGPIMASLAPRLTALQAQGDEASSLALYRSATQWVGALVWPASAVLAWQAERVLWIWTGDTEAAANGGEILRLYAIGNAILAMAAFPYYLQFAKGQLRSHLVGTGLFVIALVPGLIWATPRYGGVGAGWVWLAVNLSYFAFWVPLVHARFAPGLHARWLLHDVAPIALLSAAAALASQWLPWPDQRGLAGLELLCVAGISVFAGLAGSSWARGLLNRRATRSAPQWQ